MLSDAHARFLEELARDLRALDVACAQRTLSEMSGVNLCSNDYLGLAGNPRLRAEILRSVQESFLVASTGSRLLSGHFAVWTDLETEFARFAGTEAALYFGSGYTANIGLLTSILAANDLVFSDAANHASLIDGIRLSGARKAIYPHLNLAALEKSLRQHAHEDCRKLIVTESVFSMDGDCAAIAKLLDLADTYRAGLIVDEAHATAVHGPNGRGLVAAASGEQRVWAVVHTCGKALASIGAFVCGSERLKRALINRARTLIFSTAMPPYIARQILAALNLAKAMDRERATLFQRSLSFLTALRADGWNAGGSTSQIIPIILGENALAVHAAEQLQAAGFGVRAIRYPSVPEGQARLRISLTAQISVDILRKLCDTLNELRHLQPKRAEAVRA